MPELKPEQSARVWIDAKLEEAGWRIVNRNEYTPALRAAAIREVQMKGRKEADYVLLVDGKAAAVIEAKRPEISLDNPHLIAQAEDYTKRLLSWYPVWENPLKLVYLSNGRQIAFKDSHKASGYQLIENFHTPQDMLHLVRGKGFFDDLPPLERKGLRACQFEAISKLEDSFKSGKKRALMVLATGAGKTYTACMIAYRMLTYTPMKRILFLVDRTNLGFAASMELQTFKLTETGQPFSEIFGVEQLKNRPVSLRNGVVISTIQRLYSQLTGDDGEYSDEDVDTALCHKEGDKVSLPQDLRLPKDFFDLIIIDECHRSIYSDWKEVLDHFSSARMIGMTATPLPETESFFNNNRVANYTLEQSILDGVNVMSRIYRIKTEIGENGGEITKGTKLKVLGRKGEKNREQIAVSDRPFLKTQLNRSILVDDQIRKVLEEYKRIVYTQLYPDRTPKTFDYLPKTLIFAVSEIHAQRIVEIAKEVFERQDDKFAQAITYTSGNSNELIKEFRNSVDFRIAVTVTLVATGTDVRPLEVLIFLNDVHSSVLYTQMKGRGVRTISPDRLNEVTPNATSKQFFYLIDAVGVTESEKHLPGIGGGDGEGPLTPTLAELFEKMALRVVPDSYLELLAGKLIYVEDHSDPEDVAEYQQKCPILPKEFAARIFDALESEKLPPYRSSNDENKERIDLVRELLENVGARKKLVEMARGYVKTPEGVDDEITSSSFSFEEAKHSTEVFEEYVNAHRDEIEALRLIYNQEQGTRLTRGHLEELNQRLAENIPGYSPVRLWNDYALLKPEQVTPLGTSKDDIQAVTNLIQLVRFAYGKITKLYSLKSVAAKRFELWCGQKQREIPMTPEQKELFREIAGFIAQNGSLDVRAIREFANEITNALIRELGSAKAANEQIYSLNDFILKAA